MQKEKKYVVVYQTFIGLGDLGMDSFADKGDWNRRYKELTEEGSLAWKLELKESNHEQVLDKKRRSERR